MSDHIHCAEGCGYNGPAKNRCGSCPVSRDTPRTQAEWMELVGLPTAPRERETQPPCGVCKQPMASLREFVAHKCPGWREPPAPVPPVAEARLDFAQAHERAFGWPMKSDLDLGDLRYHDHLNSQVRAIVAKVRAERDREHQTLVDGITKALVDLDAMAEFDGASTRLLYAREYLRAVLPLPTPTPEKTP